MKTTLIERKLKGQAGLALIGKKGKPVVIDPRLTTKARLTTLAHEVAHHVNHDWQLEEVYGFTADDEEQFTTDLGAAIAKALWRDGWRRCEGESMDEAAPKVEYRALSWADEKPCRKVKKPR
jgi:hypothetical protein